MPNQRTRSRNKARGLPGNPTKRRPSSPLRRVTWSDDTVEHARETNGDNDIAELLGCIKLATRRDPHELIYKSRGHANQYLLSLGEYNHAVSNMIWEAFEQYPGDCMACKINRREFIYGVCVTAVEVCTCVS